MGTGVPGLKMMNRREAEHNDQECYNEALHGGQDVSDEVAFADHVLMTKA